FFVLPLKLSGTNHSCCLLQFRCESGFWFRKEGIIEFGIHRHLFNEDLLSLNRRLFHRFRGLRHGENFCLDKIWHLKAIYRPIIAIVDFYWMINTVEPP